MRTVDRIRKYILDHMESGEFTPGTRLPGYLNLMEMFGVSYGTIAAALKKLSAEGLLQIRNGNGTYIPGGEPLIVLINIKSTTIPHGDMLRLLEKHTAGTDLNLEFVIDEVDNLTDPRILRRKERMFKAAVSEHVQAEGICEMPPALLRDFDGYRKTLAGIKHTGGRLSDYALPFPGPAGGMGVNLRLLRRLGCDQAPPDILAVWDHLADRADKEGIPFCTIDYHPRQCGLFAQVAGILLTQVAFSPKRYFSAAPLFTSPAGNRFFDIISRIRPVEPDAPGSFQRGDAVFHPNIKSWLITQNFSEVHPEKRVDDFAFLPLIDPGGARISQVSYNCLKAFMRNDLTLNERSRVWRLLQLMCSRAFHLDFCAVTGMVSPRRDIAPHDYPWNQDGKWDIIFPRSGDFVYSIDTLISTERKFQLGMLLENYCVFGASRAETAARMDVKKQSFSWDTNI